MFSMIMEKANTYAVSVLENTPACVFMPLDRQKRGGHARGVRTGVAAAVLMRVGLHHSVDGLRLARQSEGGEEEPHRVVKAKRVEVEALDEIPHHLLLGGALTKLKSQT